MTGLLLHQPGHGYRFSLDPFLLAAFVRPRPRERIADLGAGVGVVALLLARRHTTLRAVALEIQPELAACARANAAANGCADRCHVVRGDARAAGALLRAGAFDRVVSNPPYRAPGSGRAPAHPSRALARQEGSFTFEHLASAAAALLRHGGSLDFVHLAERLPSLFRALWQHGLEPKILRLVAPFPHSPPRLCLVSARKGGRPGLAVMPQLAVHDSPGRQSREVAEALASAGRDLPDEGEKCQFR